MSTKPATRRFIGPLTPAQQKRRRLARSRFQEIASMQDARCLTFREAIKAVEWERAHRFGLIP
jgi:hypothetical protein